MIKNIQYKSIFMGSDFRYILSALVNDESYSKVLTLDESKKITKMSGKDRILYAENIFESVNKKKEEEILTEGRKKKLHAFVVIWTRAGERHQNTIEASDEKGAIEKVHSKGGTVISVNKADSVGKSNPNHLKPDVKESKEDTQKVEVEKILSECSKDTSKGIKRYKNFKYNK